MRVLPYVLAVGFMVSAAGARAASQSAGHGAEEAAHGEGAAHGDAAAKDHGANARPAQALNQRLLVAPINVN